MTTANRLRKSLKAVAILHLIITVMIGAFSIYFAGRAASLKGTENEARLNAQKIENRIQRATTLEDAKIEARAAWRTVEDIWHTLTSVMTNFSEGMQAILVVPLITFAIAVHALWVSRRDHTSDASRTTIDQP